MIVRELLTKWKILVDNKSLNELDRKIRTTKNNFDKAGKSAIKFGKNLTFFVTTPVLALQGALIKAASDAEETTSKFGTVFSALDKQANSTAKNLAKNFGLSSVAAKQLLGDTGDLLTGFGFSQDSALQLSNQVQELAVDLASFTNFSGGAKGASQALTKALLGERESIKSLGISILEEDVKRRVALNTAKGMTFESERQAKAFATLQLAQEQSKNAIGDFARTQNSFANQSRILRARLNDLAVSFGQILLPGATKTLGVVSKIVEAFNELSPEMKSFILTVSTAAAAIGPLLIAIGVMNKVFTLAKDGFDIARFALQKFSITGVLTAALVAAAFVALLLVFEDIVAFFQGRQSVTAVIVDKFNSAIDFLNEKFKKFSFGARVAISALLFPIRAVVNGIQAIGGALGALSVGDFGTALDALKQGVSKTFDTSVLSDLGAAVGFGKDERTFRLPGATPTANQASPGARATGGNTSVNVSVDAPITVPPGTPPELVGTKVKEGVIDVLKQQFRDARESVEPQVAF